MIMFLDHLKPYTKSHFMCKNFSNLTANLNSFLRFSIERHQISVMCVVALTKTMRHVLKKMV